MPFGPTHTLLRGLARKAGESFFSDVTVLNPENVPKEDPLFAAASHANMACDPLILSCWFPWGRKLHYWAKSELFQNPHFARILLDAGNLPVHRKTKDHDKLYSATFDVLKQGECVAVFPEGTSLHRPELLPLKDGVSFTALEYAKNVSSGNANKLSDGTVLSKPAKDLVICVAGITYTSKQKFRSAAIIEWAKPINVNSYLEEFLDDPKSAAKRLTSDIDRSLRSVTVNAKDWDTLTAARMARELLWPNDLKLPRESFRDINQSLIDLFEMAPASEQLQQLKKLLLAYASALDRASLTNLALGPRALPSSMDPAKTVRLPDRLTTLFHLFVDTCASLLRLPFFFLPLVIHTPVYVAARLLVRLFPGDPESLAQNKIAFGLFATIFLYPAMFMALWLFLLLTPLGALCSFGLVWLMLLYHGALIDTNYYRAKKLIGTWKVLVGIWLPSSLDEKHNRIRALLACRAEAAQMLHACLQEHPDLCARLVLDGARIPKDLPLFSKDSDSQ